MTTNNTGNKTKTKSKTKPSGRPPLGTEDLYFKYGGKPVVGDNGWRLYYSQEHLQVSVKQSHIDNGIEKKPKKCVVSLAVSDTFHDQYEVEVGLTIVKVMDIDKKKALFFKIPYALRKRLRWFDTASFWNMPPTILWLSPMPKPNKSKRGSVKKSVAAKNGGDVHVENNQVVIGTIRRKAKTRKSPTRLISRGVIVH